MKRIIMNQKSILIMGDSMERQIIHCSVHNCDFCDTQENTCELKEIKVCNCRESQHKEATMCDSFRRKEH